MDPKHLIPWHRRSAQPRGLNQWSDMDRIFESFFNDFPRSPLRSVSTLEEQGFVPSLDIKENDDAVDCTVELPGLDKEDFHISLDADQLTISGEKRSEEKHEEGDSHWVERRFGSFKRVIPLPYEIDENKVEASCKKGVLKIHLPKAQATKERTKRIEVKHHD